MMNCLVLLSSLAAVPLFAVAASSQQVLHDKTPEHHAMHSKLAKWEGCGTLNDHKLECARIDVPANHFNRSTTGEWFLLR